MPQPSHFSIVHSFWPPSDLKAYHKEPLTLDQIPIPASNVRKATHDITPCIHTFRYAHACRAILKPLPTLLTPAHVGFPGHHKLTLDNNIKIQCQLPSHPPANHSAQNHFHPSILEGQKIRSMYVHTNLSCQHLATWRTHPISFLPASLPTLASCLTCPPSARPPRIYS